MFVEEVNMHMTSIVLDGALPGKGDFPPSDPFSRLALLKEAFQAAAISVKRANAREGAATPAQQVYWATKAWRASSSASMRSLLVALQALPTLQQYFDMSTYMLSDHQGLHK